MTEQYDVRVNDSYGVMTGSNNSMTVNVQQAIAPVRWPVTYGREPATIKGAVDRRGRLAGAVSEGMPIVLVGDGGVGKTELAAQEFRAHRARIALWVTATSRTSVLSAYRSAAGKLRLDLGGDDESTADELLGWLARTDEPWVVVLDDIAHPADVHGLIPQGLAGLTLLTTRWDTSAVDAVATRVDVGVYTIEEAAHFLRNKLRSLKIPGLLDAATELAAELGHLPLALGHAAAVLREDRLTCAAYLAKLRSPETIAELMPLDPQEAGIQYQTPVAAAWQLALDRADARHPAGLARPLWSVISCLDSNGIPEGVLLTEPVRTRLSASQGVPVTRTQAKKALHNLAALSLIQLSPGTIRTHTIPQRVTRETLGPGLLHLSGRLAADALADFWPADETDRATADRLAANIDVLRTVCPEPLWEPDAHALLFSRGRIFGKTGRPAEAAGYFRALAGECADRLGPAHEDTRLAREEQAEWLAEAGDYDQAVAVLRMLLAESGPTASLGLQLRLAGYLGHADDAAAALTLLDRVVGEAAERNDVDALHLLNLRAERARWRAVAGDPERALAELGDLLTALRAIRDPRLAEFGVRSIMAECREVAGQPAAALREWRSLAEEATRELGPTDATTLTIRHRRILAEATAGTVAAAATEQQRLYDDLSAVFAPEAPRLIRARLDLARYQGRADSPGRAVEELTEALADARRRARPEAELYGIRESLAKWRGRSGQPDLARRDYQELLADQRAELGEEHTSVLLSRYQLIYWSGVADQDLFTMRQPLLTLLEDARRFVGDDHPITTRCEIQLLTLRQIDGDDVTPEAAALLDRLTARGERDTLDGFTLQNALLADRLSRGDLEALRECRRLLPLVEARHGPGHPMAKALRHNIGKFTPESLARGGRIVHNKNGWTR
ncbi:NB-ARC domain-containing protein [Micromonospora sp. CA-249363]|uniref:NB-ARC domain-containing protein n=1 Tax=Micromonospora sp. CA-249363 TaxID=3239963 RepID=UPI003D923582